MNFRELLYFLFTQYKRGLLFGMDQEFAFIISKLSVFAKGISIWDRFKILLLQTHTLWLI